MQDTFVARACPRPVPPTRRRCLLAALLMLTPACAHAQTTVAEPAPARAFEVDMSGVDRFWDVAQVLSRDETPDSAAWRALFETPAYAALNNEQRIRDDIELAFRPSNSARLDSLLTHANYWRRRDLLHLVRVRGAIDELREYQATLDIDAAIRQGLREAAVYLPAGATEAPPPPIRFVIFSPDARVMRGNIIFDLAFTYDLGFDLLASTMAHEFHHYLIGDDARFHPPAQEDPHYGLIRAIRQLQVEGVADLIDKEAVDSARADDPDWHERWRVPFSTTAGRLASFDSLLVELATDSTRLVAHGRRALDELFPMAGHPNGNAMARLIERELGREAIIRSLGNPFEFFRLYDEAARRSGTGHAFSAGARAYLARLEERFVDDDPAAP